MDAIVGLFIVLGLAYLLVPWIALAKAVSAGRRAEKLELEVRALRERVFAKSRDEHVESPEPRRVEPSMPHRAASSPPTPVMPLAGEVARPALPPVGPPVAGSANEDELEIIELEPEPLTELLARVPTDVKAPSVSPGPTSASKPPTPTPKPLPHPRPAPAAKPPINWEKRLAASIPWLGAIALAFAGIFAVKVMSKHGMFGPGMRLICSMVFGVGLIGAAEWVRRNQAKIAEAMAAAGVTVLYAVVMAAFRLHDMLDQLPAFGAIVLITVAAVVLSLRHGPLVALLGLIGGFAMPAVLSTGKPPPVELFVYLLLLEIGLTAVTRGRQWWWLTLLTMIGGLGWSALWISLFYNPHNNPHEGHWVGLFLLASIASFVFATVRTTEAQRGGSTLARAIPWFAVLLGLAIVAWLVGASGFTMVEWGFLGVLGAGCIVLGRIERRFFPLAAIAATMSALLLGAWGASEGGFEGPSAADFAHRFGWIVLGLGVLYAAGAYIAMWGSQRPAAWATLSALAGIAYIAVAWQFLGDALAGAIPPWWAITAIFAGFYTVESMPVQQRRAVDLRFDGAMAAMMIAVTALLSASAVLAVNQYHEQLGPYWITVAWAIEVAGLAWIAGWLNLPRLRYIIASVAAAVALRLLANPAVLHYPIDPHVLLNWLPIGYGLPLICFVVAAWRLRRDGQMALSEWLEIGAIGFAFALATLLVRHGFHPDHLTIDALGLTEFTTYSVVWMSMALVVLAGAERWTDPVLQYGARIVAGIGLVAAIVGPGFIVNPFWMAHDVGDAVIFNGLLYAFALPAAIAGINATLLARNGETRLSRVFALGAIGLGLLTTGLFVHHGFHPRDMTQHDASLIELGTYSVVWGVLGVALLAIGLWLRRDRVTMLGRGVVVLSFVATLFSLMVANPLTIRHPIGASPVLNSLLYVYGLPTLLMAIAAWLTDRAGQKPLADVFGGIAMAMLAGTAALLVHHGFHPGDMTAQGVSLLEYTALAAVWGAIGLTLTHAGQWADRSIIRSGGIALTMLSFIITLLGAGLIANPLWAHEAVGSMRVLNWLLFAYGLPAIFAIAATHNFRRRGPAALATFTALCALLLSFTLVTTEVRQAFHGNHLDAGAPAPAEMYSYSAAWILFAAALLTAGIATGGKLLRWASLAVMLIAVIKVFAFDTRRLEDLWRVLSYLGLGASLMLVAWVYQRFVFRRIPAQSAEPATESTPPHITP